MSSNAASHAGHANGSSVPAGPAGAPTEAAPERRAQPTAAEILRERALAAGEEIAEYMRRRAAGEPVPEVIDRKAELAATRREAEELRRTNETLSRRNGELERQLAKIARDIKSGRPAAGEEGEAELRRRVETLTKHLDAADRHVSTMRDRLDAETADAARRINQLETRLAAREAELGGQVERLEAALAGETARLQKKVDDLEAANESLAAEAKAAAVAAAQQRQGLESRVTALLADVEDAKGRYGQAIADRDRRIVELQREGERNRSAASLEQVRLRQALAESEANRRRDIEQHNAAAHSLKSTIASLERDLASTKDSAEAERRRLEGAIIDERDRGRRQIEARDEERRRIEARAQAAEKQAAAATATATAQLARLQQLEIELGEARIARIDEINALNERVAAFEGQLVAAESSSSLVIDDLRLRLAERTDDTGDADQVAAAQLRIQALTDELEELRSRVAEYEKPVHRPVVVHEAAPAEDPAEADILELHESAAIVEAPPPAQPAPAPHKIATVTEHAGVALWRRRFGVISNGRR
jgi:hypothetical protein